MENLTNLGLDKKSKKQIKTKITDFCNQTNKWLDKVIFNRVLNPIFGYKRFADLLIKKNSEIELPYKKRLEIYNRVYQFFQYGHIYFVGEEGYKLILNLLGDLQESGITTNLIGIGFNGILALHIRYNRERVKNILEKME